MSISLRDLITAVQDRKLSKEQLEGYFDQLSELSALLRLELADIQKEGALFLDACDEKTNADKERKWKVTQRGQREIELKQYIEAIKPLLASVKNRIYSKL